MHAAQHAAGCSSAGDDAARAARKRSSKAPGPGNKRGWVDEKVPHFRLRDDAEAGDAAVEDMQQLRAMFGSMLPNAVMAEVYAASQNDVQRSVDALLVICEGSQRAARPEDGAHHDPDGAGAGASTSAPVRASSGQHSKAATQHHAGPRWRDLPADCQLLVVSMLDARGLAAMAAADRGCGGLVAARRARMSAVLARCSIPGLPACLRCHPYASKVWLDWLDIP